MTARLTFGRGSSLAAHVPLMAALLFAIVYFPLVVYPYAVRGITFYDEMLMFHATDRELQGQTHFRDFYGRRNGPPGIEWFLAPHIMAWGHSNAAIISARITNVLLLFLTGIMVFALGRRCAGPWVGTTAAVLLWTNQAAMRNAGFAMTEIPATFFVVLAIWLAFGSDNRLRLVPAGIAAGLAAFFRIEAAILILPLTLAVLMFGGAQRTRRAVYTVLAFLAPWGLYLAWLGAKGLVPGFLMCVVKINAVESVRLAWHPTPLRFAEVLNVWPALGAWNLTGLDVTKVAYLLGIWHPSVGLLFAMFAGASVALLAAIGLAGTLRRPARPAGRAVALALCGAAVLWYGFFLVIHRLTDPILLNKLCVMPSPGLALALALGLRSAALYVRNAGQGGRVQFALAPYVVAVGAAAVVAWLPLPRSLPVEPFRATATDPWRVNDVVVQYVKDRGAAGSVVTDSPLLLFLLGQPTSFWDSKWVREGHDKAGITSFFPHESFRADSLQKTLGGPLLITRWNYDWDPVRAEAWDPEGYRFIETHYRPDAEVGYYFYLLEPDGRPGKQTAWLMGFRVFRLR